MSEEVKVIKNDDGTIEVDGKKFISKESYDVVAEKQRTATEKIAAIEQEKTDAEKKRLEEEGKWKELADKREAELKAKDEAIATERKSNALKLAAQAAGAKNTDTISKLVDASKIEVDADGNIKAESVTALLDGLKTTEPYLFGEAVKAADNAGAGNGGAGEGGSGGGTPTFYRSQLSDSKFYADNRAEILKAEAAGAIKDDINGGAVKV